jgi:hypothetical protein
MGRFSFIAPIISVPTDGEKLRRISETLELERIAARIDDEKRRLFANLSLKTGLRRDQKFGFNCLKVIGKRTPVSHVEDDAEMTRRDRIAVHWICGCRCIVRVDEVQSDLVAKEVQVDPAGCCASFATTQEVAVKSLGRVKIRYG